MVYLSRADFVHCVLADGLDVTRNRGGGWWHLRLVFLVRIRFAFYHYSCLINKLNFCFLLFWRARFFCSVTRMNFYGNTIRIKNYICILQCRKYM